MAKLNTCVCGHYPWAHTPDGCPVCECKIVFTKPDPDRLNPNCWGRGSSNLPECTCLILFRNSKKKSTNATAVAEVSPSTSTDTTTTPTAIGTS